MCVTIKEINSIETHAVRHLVLRNGLPIETCFFKGDDLDTTFHLGAYENETLLGIATFLLKSKTAIQEVCSDAQSMYQLRGMAVIENQQGKGVGKKIMITAEQLLKGKSIDILWFHARTSAVPFYKKLGYTVVGEELWLEPAGPHFKMFKRL